MCAWEKFGVGVVRAKLSTLSMCDFVIVWMRRLHYITYKDYWGTSKLERGRYGWYKNSPNYSNTWKLTIPYGWSSTQQLNILKYV